MFICAELQEIPKQGAVTFEKELGDTSPSQMCLANPSHAVEWLCLCTGEEVTSGETWTYSDQDQAQSSRNNVYSYFAHCVLMRAFLINLTALGNHSTSSQLVFLLTGKTTQIKGSGVGAAWINI